MNAIEIKDLCKTYPGFSLDHVNLTLPCGCIMGLVGENGAGKSTTIRLILDMIARDSGTITLLGKDNRENIRLLKEDIGVVLDEVGIPACLNPKQVGKIMANTFRNWEQAVYDSLLEKLAVPPEKPFKDFSKGMKMKLGIAIALSHRPKLLILDEATSGLDPVVRDEVLDLFSEFTREESHAVLISSHIVSDLEKICDYIAFLHKGRLLLCEEKDALKEKYGILRCSREQLSALPPEAVIGRKETAYGVEAIAARDAVPAGLSLSPIDIEELFIFMVKGANQQ
ncbi:MAG: ABC transporter ATP-binding protein [Oscillospiraceae bacterium]|nr:ABC transporter ATP-binding protein [Clostridiales bacterium]MDD7673937.1 ABC transporter ATP-binding protein [Oscillospiraceae bacterium]